MTNLNNQTLDSVDTIHDIKFKHGRLYIDNEFVSCFNYKEAVQYCDDYLTKDYSKWIVFIKNKNKKYYLILISENRYVSFYKKYKDVHSDFYTFSKIHSHNIKTTF